VLLSGSIILGIHLDFLGFAIVLKNAEVDQLSTALGWVFGSDGEGIRLTLNWHHDPIFESPSSHHGEGTVRLLLENWSGLTLFVATHFNTGCITTQSNVPPTSLTSDISHEELVGAGGDGARSSQVLCSSATGSAKSRDNSVATRAQVRVGNSAMIKMEEGCVSQP
jgi:hypothetical protein